MDITESYSLLFVDTLVSNFAFNNNSELVLNAMKIFGSYDAYIIIIVSTIAFLLSSCVNYIFGKLCFKVISPISKEEGPKNFNRIENIRKNKYLFLILSLSAVPFYGKMVVLFAGFCDIKFTKTIAITTSARFIYYLLFMMI